MGSGGAVPASFGAVLASAGAVLASAALLMLVVIAQPAAAALAPAQAAAPTSHLKNGVCLVSGAPSVVPGTAALVVAPRPTGLKILWLPGLNSTTCAIATTHAGPSTAATLARAITHAPAVPTGAVINCPNDDGTRALISFTYAQRRSAPHLVVALGGCQFISQSGKEQRTTTSAVRDKLADLAPCGWRTYFAADSPRAC
jgi:hypothetical protein